MRNHKRKGVVYVSFIDLEKAYDEVNREVLWQILKMYDVGPNLLSGIKSVYVESSVCVSIKGVKVSSLG